MMARTVGLLMLAVMLAAPLGAKAQTSSPPAAPAAASSEHHMLKAEELDALVAPIALYPDQLLSQVLMASTYPLEIVQAERFVKANKNLKGDALEAAAAKERWDDSVKSLTATPSVIDMMSSKLDWTEKLGNAVVAQEADVMDAIQRLRAKAQAANKLTTTKEQTVTVKQVNSRQIIAIEPTDPNTVYVPYYDPGVVYGGWPYPAYPPYYFPPPGYIAAGIIATGLAFGAGYALGRWASGGYWGGSINWSNNNINVGGGNWQRPGGGGGGRGPHVGHHRGQGGRNLNFRGRNGNQVLRPGNGRGNLGNRNGASTRPSNRPQVGHHRASGGARNRPSVGHRGANRAGNLGSRGGIRHRAGGGGGGIRHRAAGGGGLRGHGGGGLRGGGGHRGGGAHRGGGGGHRGGGGGRGGGRRSDIQLKHDIWFVGRAANGLDLYHFVYNGGHKAYVGVMAQEVQQVMPQAVERGPDGYLRVHYEQIGVKFESYDHWLKDNEHHPAAVGWQ